MLNYKGLINFCLLVNIYYPLLLEIKDWNKRVIIGLITAVISTITGSNYDWQSFGTGIVNREGKNRGKN